MPIYCGLQTPSPSGVPIGSPNACYKQGLRSGFVAGIQKGRKEEKQKQKIKETISLNLNKQQIAKEIETKGLTFLKQQLHLNNMTKDLIRSIATKLTNTDQAIPYYSRLTREELVQQLIQRGFRE